MDSLTDEGGAEIDALILAGAIIPAMMRLMRGCGVGLRDAGHLFRTRYRQLRDERGVEFACGEEEYWSGYGEDIFEAVAKGW